MPNLSKKILWSTIGLIAVVQIATAGELHAPKTVLNPSGDSMTLQMSFKRLTTGDLYLAVATGGAFWFITEDMNLVTVPTPFRTNGTYSGELTLLDIPSDAIPSGGYTVYQLTTYAGGDPYNIADWQDPMNMLRFTVGESEVLDGDRDNDGFADDDLDKDGFADNDLDKDGFADDDLDKDGFADDDLDQDGFADDDLDQDGFADDDLDEDGFADDDVNRDGLVDAKDAEAIEKTRIAMDKITAYAENSENPEPTIQDYIDANIDVTGLSIDLLLEITQDIAFLTEDEMDSKEELNALVERVSNSAPVALYDRMEVSIADGSAELELTAYDDDVDDTLTYSIVDGPFHGDIELIGNKVIYTPDANYSEDNQSQFNDEFVFKVNDGTEDSELTPVDIVVSRTATSATRRSTQGKKYLIWFNGTSEDISHNDHLFKGLTPREHTVIKGWGASPFIYLPRTPNTVADNAFNYVQAQIAAGSGVDNSTHTYNVINRYIESRLKGQEDYINNSESLMIGGFSRGAAFFVPYFLNRLDRFLPGLKATTASGQPKELIIFLMDPVNGSKDDNDVTATALRANSIYTKADKEALVQKLKDKGFSVKLIYLSSGFDYRQRNFKLDKSFYEAQGKFDSVYTAKLGISHANMSIWSKDNYGSNLLNGSGFLTAAIDYGPYDARAVWDKVGTDSNALRNLKSAFSGISPDLYITRSIFRAYLKEAIRDPRVCKEESKWVWEGLFPSSKTVTTCTNSPGPASVPEVEALITGYHNLTEEYFGQSAANRGMAAEFTIGASIPAQGAYKVTDNLEYYLQGHSRLGIPKTGNLADLF